MGGGEQGRFGLRGTLLLAYNSKLRVKEEVVNERILKGAADGWGWGYR